MDGPKVKASPKDVSTEMKETYIIFLETLLGLSVSHCIT